MAHSHVYSRATPVKHLYDSHPSIDASLEDFETPSPGRVSSTAALSPSPELDDSPTRTRFEYTTSPAHSVHLTASHPRFLADDQDSDLDVPGSPDRMDSSYARPAWTAKATGLFDNTYQRAVYQSPSRTRDGTPQHGELDEASRVPLPHSPEKHTPRTSPEPDDRNTAGRDLSPVPDQPSPEEPKRENYYRFQAHFDVQQRTAPLEATVASVQKAYITVTGSWRNTIGFLVTLYFSWTIYQALTQRIDDSGPNLLHGTHLARNFEPMLQYSETGLLKVSELQQTNVAVWDLSESIRESNMSSSAIIVTQLEGLGDSLKVLGLQLTQFFSNVDGDVDGVIHMMNWAKAELTRVTSGAPKSVSLVVENMRNIGHQYGGSAVSNTITKIFGQTYSQLCRSKVQNVFISFLNEMEAAISRELEFAMQLIALFDSVENQFDNIHRATIRESTMQEIEFQEEGVLSALWRRLVNDQSRLQKFEKNLALLSNVQKRTSSNKLILMDHKNLLIQLKTTLEGLRRRLLRPLVRSNATSATIEEQVVGLDDVAQYLQAARDEQKKRQLRRLALSGSKRIEQADWEERTLEASSDLRRKA